MISFKIFESFSELNDIRLLKDFNEKCIVSTKILEVHEIFLLYVLTDKIWLKNNQLLGCIMKLQKSNEPYDISIYRVSEKSMVAISFGTVLSLNTLASCPTVIKVSWFVTFSETNLKVFQKYIIYPLLKTLYWHS